MEGTLRVQCRHRVDVGHRTRVAAFWKQRCWKKLEGTKMVEPAVECHGEPLGDQFSFPGDDADTRG